MNIKLENIKFLSKFINLMKNNTLFIENVLVLSPGKESKMKKRI
jgi:hypothetical protein